VPTGNFAVALLQQLGKLGGGTDFGKIAAAVDGLPEIGQGSLKAALTALLTAYSDEAGHLHRFDAGRRTDLKPARVPI
jgi:hypothetical protein